ncbi:hypothetical protein IACHDJAJ_00167 [Aeromonas phage vB_AdhS_TS3]|nr:hypothetical protein IACHDJAJ_00167 [Aeromonas phage vB_AdhS_TS3]
MLRLLKQMPFRARMPHRLPRLMLLLPLVRLWLVRTRRRPPKLTHSLHSPRLAPQQQRRRVQPLRQRRMLLLPRLLLPRPLHKLQTQHSPPPRLILAKTRQLPLQLQHLPKLVKLPPHRPMLPVLQPQHLPKLVKLQPHRLTQRSLQLLQPLKLEKLLLLRLVRQVLQL